jgi:hypothetical protein
MVQTSNAPHIVALGCRIGCYRQELGLSSVHQEDGEAEKVCQQPKAFPSSRMLGGDYGIGRREINKGHEACLPCTALYNVTRLKIYMAGFGFGVGFA